MPVRFVDSKRKGKQKALERDDSSVGESGPEGTVIPLKYVGTSDYDAAYVLPVKIGSNSQTFNLQVDTGSSDLWVVSNKCSSCSAASSKYDPSSSTSSNPTLDNVQIGYVSGNVGGPIYWDTVNIGGYTIQNQAFASCDSVASEPLSVYSGVFGLALPDNSVIAHTILPTTSNAPDGAPFMSNVFSIPLAPEDIFVSLTLERPGSSRIPSTLGIGKHPPVGSVTLADSLGGSSAVLGGDQVTYGRVLASSSSDDNLHWKIGVSDISVWVDGKETKVELTKEFATAGESPADGISAVLDSGAPAIVTNDGVAAAVYAPFGIEPSSDGMYYMSCSTPLNMSLTINGAQYPLHPLDLTVPPSLTSNTDACLGLIQPMTSQLSNVGIADMVLGIPFLRSVYFVMTYYNPQPLKGSTVVSSAVGSQPSSSATSVALSATSSVPVSVPATIHVSSQHSKRYTSPHPPERRRKLTDQDLNVQNVNGPLDPHIGLQTLIDPSTALTEFTRVRIQNSPLDPPTPPSTSSSGNGKDSNAVMNKRTLKIGEYVLIGVGGFIGLCIILFLIRWVMYKKRYGGADGKGDVAFVPVASSEVGEEDENREAAGRGGALKRLGSMVSGVARSATSSTRRSNNSSADGAGDNSERKSTTGTGKRSTRKRNKGEMVTNRGDSIFEYQVPSLSEKFSPRPGPSPLPLSTASPAHSHYDLPSSNTPYAGDDDPFRSNSNSNSNSYSSQTRQNRYSAYLAKKERDLQFLENPLLSPIPMPRTQRSPMGSRNVSDSSVQSNNSRAPLLG